MKRTRPEQLWMFGTGVAAFLVVAIGWFFLISPQRGETDDVRSATADSELTNTTLQHDIAVLQSENAKLSTYRNALTQAQLALPSASGLPDFLRTLQSIGSATATDVSQLSVGAPTSLDPTGAASASPSPSASASTGTSTAAPVAAANTVYALPISAQLTGTPAHLRAFLTQLQTVQPRAVLISSIVEGAATTTGRSGAASARTTLQLTMQAFVAPGLAPVPAATPSAPTPSATSTP